MALPTTLSFGKMIVLLEDLTTPGTYAAPCGFTDKSLEFAKELADVVIPDCDDPDAAAWVGREVRSLSYSISGEGVLALEAIPTWQELKDRQTSRNVRVIVSGDTTGGTPGNGGFYQGRAHLESFSQTGTLGEKLRFNISMQSDGAWTYTPY